VLAEALAWLTTPFPRRARRLGYLAEQIAIRAKWRRHRTAWAPHLAASHAAMLAAADACPRRDLAVVLGGGVCLDVPVAALAGRFARVVLIDVGFAERPARAERLPWDVTGRLASWHDDPCQSDDDACAAPDPGWPTGLGDPDLTISANLLGQLHLLPAAWLARHRPRPADFPERLAQALARAHLAWLRRLPGCRLLIADVAEVAVQRDGTVADDQPLPVASLLPPPDQSWMWNLAPIPEWDDEHHLHHRVGTWRFDALPTHDRPGR
jgi:hypothetical protein